MGITPGTHNLTVVRRSDHSLSMQFLDAAGTAISLVGATITAECWDQSRSKKYADFSVTYVDRAAGRAKIELTDAQTVSLPDVAYYDVLLTASDGRREYYLTGKISTLQGYTS